MICYRGAKVGAQHRRGIENLNGVRAKFICISVLRAPRLIANKQLKKGPAGMIKRRAALLARSLQLCDERERIGRTEGSEPPANPDLKPLGGWNAGVFNPVLQIAI